MKNYVVKVCNNDEVYYLTPKMYLCENLTDNVLWSADEWDIDSINNFVKSDSEMCGYTYKIEDYYKESLKMTVKLKRDNDIKENDIVIAPDFILVYNLIKEGYRVIEVSDEYHTYKEKWKEGE